MKLAVAVEAALAGCRTFLPGHKSSSAWVARSVGAENGDFVGAAPSEAGGF